MRSRVSERQLLPGVSKQLGSIVELTRPARRDVGKEKCAALPHISAEAQRRENGTGTIFLHLLA